MRKLCHLEENVFQMRKGKTLKDQALSSMQLKKLITIIFCFFLFYFYNVLARAVSKTIGFLWFRCIMGTLAIRSTMLNFRKGHEQLLKIL